MLNEENNEENLKLMASKKPINVKHLKLISRVNNDVFSNNFEKMRNK